MGICCFTISKDLDKLGAKFHGACFGGFSSSYLQHKPMDLCGIICTQSPTYTSIRAMTEIPWFKSRVEYFGNIDKVSVFTGYDSDVLIPKPGLSKMDFATVMRWGRQTHEHVSAWSTVERLYNDGIPIHVAIMFCNHLMGRDLYYNKSETHLRFVEQGNGHNSLDHYFGLAQAMWWIRYGHKKVWDGELPKGEVSAYNDEWRIPSSGGMGWQIFEGCSSAIWPMTKSTSAGNYSPPKYNTTIWKRTFYHWLVEMLGIELKKPDPWAYGTTTAIGNIPYEKVLACARILRTASRLFDFNKEENRKAKEQDRFVDYVNRSWTKLVGEAKQ